jgi:hypothetical protein
LSRLIDPQVLAELIALIETTRGKHHPVALLLRRAAETNSLKDHVQALQALDALTLGAPEGEAPVSEPPATPADRAPGRLDSAT